MTESDDSESDSEYFDSRNYPLDSEIQPYSEPVLQTDYIDYVSRRSRGPTGLTRFTHPLSWYRNHAPYGRDSAQNPLYGPVSWQQYFPTWDHMDEIDKDIPWDELCAKLEEKGYEFIESIGSGSFGDVWKVKDLNNDRMIACKVMAIALMLMYRSPTEAVQEMRKESDLMKRLRHKHIVRVYDIVDYVDPNTGFPCLYHCIFTQLCEGSLFQLIRRFDLLDESASHLWFVQIADALYYLHNNSVSHLDIKSSNILYRMIGPNILRFKLCDFGLTRVFAEDEPNISTEIRGTPQYMPPEVRYDNTYDTKPYDIFSLGVTLVESLCGKLRDQNLQTTDWLFESLNRSYSFKSPVVRLILAMTQNNPRLRPTIGRLFRYPWVLRRFALPLNLLNQLQQSSPELPILKRSHSNYSNYAIVSTPSAIVSKTI